MYMHSHRGRWEREKTIQKVTYEKTIFLVLIIFNSLFAADSYEIEVAHNDELFIMNGEKFEAKTYCLGWDSGEYVIFLDGSPMSACATAVLYNVNRKQKCEVWGE